MGFVCKIENIENCANQALAIDFLRKCLYSISKSFPVNSSLIHELDVCDTKHSWETF